MPGLPIIVLVYFMNIPIVRECGLHRIFPPLKHLTARVLISPLDGAGIKICIRNYAVRRQWKVFGTDIEADLGADLGADKGGAAIFTMPDDLNFDLGKGAMFPMAHTVEMVQKARSDKKFFTAVVFDGSDDEGPVEINTFIGKPANAMKIVEPSKALDMTLLNTPAWNVRMAVFPTQNEEESSDYEMSMIFHENGIISDMLIEYDDFSVTQKLVALEKLEGEQCGSRKAPQASENSPKYDKKRDQENQNKKQ